MRTYIFLCSLFFTFCVGVRLYEPTYVRQEVIEVVVFSLLAVIGWMFVIFTPHA